MKKLKVLRFRQFFAAVRTVTDFRVAASPIARPIATLEGFSSEVVTVPYDVRAVLAVSVTRVSHGRGVRVESEFVPI